MVFAQRSKVISGKVLDQASHEPLIGATIIEKGTTNGTITNVNGEFNLLVEGPNLKDIAIEVSFLGYKALTWLPKMNDENIIYLSEDVSSLDEVVVTSSYGTKKLKQEVVGSITSLKPKDIILEQSVTSFDQLLEGQSAGVYLEQSAELGKPINIHIRGQGSLSSLTTNSVGTSTQPLIIVDGVYLSEEIVIDGSNFFDGGGGKVSENLMNPLAKVGIQEIESINILKDAAAVSLYGADGANGVIIITTKKGEKGPVKVNFSAQGGLTTERKGQILMNGQQYSELKNLYYINSGQPGSVKNWNGVDTDWYDLLNRTGSSQSYQLSATGGSGNFRVRGALGYSAIEEPQINNNFKNLNGSVSLSYIGEKLDVSVKFSPAVTTKNTPNTFYSFAVDPTVAPYDEEGNFTRFEFYGNPLAVAYQNMGLVRTRSMMNSARISYNLSKSLSISSTYGMDFSNKYQDTFYSGLNETGIDAKGKKGYRMIRNRNTRNWNWNANISYKKDFGANSHFDVLAGLETKGEFVAFDFVKGKGFEIYDIPQSVELAEEQDSEEDTSESTRRSFFSQVHYDYAKKYFIEGTIRIDQSSAFGTDNNTSVNGAVGASWVLSQEEFLKNSQWIQFLRIRTSYGSSGNSRIGSYRALGLYTFNDTGNNGYNRGDYAEPSSAPNPYLGWEKNYKTDFGIDFTTKKNLSINLDFYNDDIRDMIVSRDVIPEIGYNSVQINGANMYNRGVELGVSTLIVSKPKFIWRLNFNTSQNVNKVTHLQGLESDFSTAATARAQRIGYSTSIIWGYDFVGIDPATGRELYNLDGEIFDGNTISRVYNDQTNWKPIGNTQPDFYGGLNNRFTIAKNLEIAFSMSFSLGGDKLVAKETVDHYRVMTNRNLSVNAYTDSWREIGDIAMYPSVVSSNPLISNSTKYLYSTSRVKLNSVNIAYKIPVKKMNLPIKTMRIYLNSTNLQEWYFDKSPEGKNGVKEMSSIYPKMRTFTMGLNLSF